MPSLDRVVSLDQIGFLLGRAYYSYIGLLQQWLDEEGLSEHIKPGMGSLLFALFREDRRSIKHLVAELQIAKSTMSGMVARMREMGLITVEPDPDDGRSSRLRLTPLARSFKKRCVRLAGEMEELLGSKLLDDEREQFCRALALVTQTIAETLDSESSGRQRNASGKKRKSTGPNL